MNYVFLLVPEQKEGEITKIVVSSVTEKETRNSRNSNKVPYLKLDQLSDQSGDTGTRQRRISRASSGSSGDCVLMDLSDTDSMDFLLMADDQHDRGRVYDVAMPDVSV